MKRFHRRLQPRRPSWHCLSPRRIATAKNKKQSIELNYRNGSLADKKLHRLILQVNTNDPAMMNLALNNATNVTQYYKDLGEKVNDRDCHFRSGPAYAAGRHLAGQGEDQGNLGKHAINLLRGLRQYPGKHEQG